MQFYKLISALLYGILFLVPTSAHRLCTACIPLSDLVAEAYGVEIAANGLSSAVAFHNGSMVPLGAVVASREYRDLMQPILTKAIGQDMRKSEIQCSNTRLRSQTSPFDRSFLDFLVAVFSWPTGQLRKSLTKQQVIELPALHPIAQLVRAQMLSLPPFNNLTSEKLSELAVGITLPSWLIGTEEACHIVTAAERTFGRLTSIESVPSSAYTAAGYELCRISYEAFECTGPGRIMTLEYDGNVAVASILQTPVSAWFANPVTFSVSTSQGITKWIDSIVSETKPDKLMLVGRNISDAVFADAIAKLSVLHANPPLSRHHILAFGAAQAAKDHLESQADDCSEPEECEILRRKADAIGGTYRPIRPSTWPAVGNRHVEL